MSRYPAREAAARLDHSEFGGAPGLIQPVVAPDGSPGHVEPTPSEQATILRSIPTAPTTLLLVV